MEQMTETEFDYRYFRWLTSQVKGGKIRRVEDYTNVLTYLHIIGFEFCISMDSNRYEDGLELRTEFMDHIGYTGGVTIGNKIVTDLGDIGPCSILEMMIALSRRMEDQIMTNDDYGDRTGIWFWDMVNSLGLMPFDDRHFDGKKVNAILHTFLRREYDFDGRGGLFTIPDTRTDMRDIEIWYQMHKYLATI